MRKPTKKKPVLPKWAMRAYPREYYAVGLEFSNVAVVGEEGFGCGE